MVDWFERALDAEDRAEIEAGRAERLQSRLQSAFRSLEEGSSRRAELAEALLAEGLARAKAPPGPLSDMGEWCLRAKAQLMAVEILKRDG